MPSHTKTERDKKKRKVQAKSKKKVKKAKKVKKVATFAERMGWTSNTEDIYITGGLQPTVDDDSTLFALRNEW